VLRDGGGPGAVVAVFGEGVEAGHGCGAGGGGGGFEEPEAEAAEAGGAGGEAGDVVGFGAPAEEGKG